MSMQRIFVIGNLGQDPKLNTTQNDKSVCNFSIAHNLRYYKDGEWKQKAQWFKVTVWGKQAESCAEYLSKGSLCCVEGELSLRMWKDDEGDRQGSLEINAQNVTFLGGGQEKEEHEETHEEESPDKESANGGGQEDTPEWAK